MAYGAKLLVNEGDEVKRGQRIAEWDPYTRPVLAEVDGEVAFEDLVDGASVAENTDETTGFTKRVVIDWRTNQRGDGLKPALTITRKGAVAKVDRGGEARYLLSVDAVIAVEPGEKVSPGDVLARIPLESAKTKDITGGLPRVAELFEARRPKDHAIIAEINGTIKFGRDYKNKRRIIIEPEDKSAEPVEYLIPKGKPFHLQEGDAIEKGEYILDGNPAPHDILAIKGVEELARYLVNEIQEVYRLQGVLINDKHIEVIVRQMLQKVEIINPGDSGMLKDEQLDKLDFDELNDQLVADGKKPATANPVLLGITKASLQTRVVHLGRLVPGNHPRPHRGGGFRQGRSARRPQGERHRRPPHPGGHRRRDHQGQADRRPSATTSSSRSAAARPRPSHRSRRPVEPAE